jgi:hypothetical protein
LKSVFARVLGERWRKWLREGIGLAPKNETNG